MKPLLLCSLLLPALTAFSQKQQGSRFDAYYFSMHSFTTTTCLQDTLVEKLVKKTQEQLKSKASKDEIVFYRATPPLSDSFFKQLTPKEHFIYAHQYPESYMQNCSFSGFDAEEDKKIFAHLPFMIEGVRMSKRQATALEKNRDSSLVYLKQCITSAGNIPLAYKMTINNLDAYELIPLIVATEKANPGKDTYLYSLVMEMMEKDKFDTFIKSDLYKELYGERKSYRTSIASTAEKRQAIISMATAWFEQKQKR
ncbi:MAG: hypothetical protein QM731_06090 [Chitinophagaceae bacterium]